MKPVHFLPPDRVTHAVCGLEITNVWRARVVRHPEGATCAACVTWIKQTEYSQGERQSMRDTPEEILGKLRAARARRKEVAERARSLYVQWEVAKNETETSAEEVKRLEAALVIATQQEGEL